MGNSKTKQARNRGSTKSSNKDASSTSTPSEDNPAWEWKDDSDWKSYDKETIDIIEKAYANGTTSIVLDHGYFGKQGGYTIDLTRFEQIKVSTGHLRQIRRNPTATPLSGSTSSSSSYATPTVTLEDNAQTTDNSPTWYFKVRSLSSLLRIY